MEITGIGSGAMLALAAGLWLVYLVPSWLRRREYLATELNAVRLQQTLRVLAETAEMPAAVRVEASARSVAQQERVLHAQQRIADAAARARIAAAARADRGARVEAVATASTAAQASTQRLAAMRLRRTRAMTSVVLFASVVTLTVQLVLLATTGMASGTPAVLAFAGIGSLTSISLLGRLASVSRARSAGGVRSVPVARRVTMSEREVSQEPVAVAGQTVWTPVPVPKPLYLSRSAADASATDHAKTLAALRAAAAEADSALRSAQLSPEVVSISWPAEAPPAAPTAPVVAASRFAAMGVVDTLQLNAPNLDEVMRRRRAAG